MRAIAIAAGTAGCGGDLSTLEPAGPAAGAIALLWWIMLAGSFVILLVVSVVLAIAWVRPSALRRVPPRHLIVWGGIVLPGIVLAALVAAAFMLGERMIAASTDSQPLTIEASARQWVWEFSYPESGGGTSTDTLHIPAGRDIAFIVTSSDVIHSFWIPRLGGKIDAIPGHVNHITLRADRPGSYGGVCAEFCGEGHTTMRFSVQAHAVDDYDAAVARATGRGTRP